jgi:hypothetical protein
MAEIDLTGVKEEINKRKAATGQINESGNNVPKKDIFLQGLINSLQSGKPSEATQMISEVEVRTSEKLGETPKRTVMASDLKTAPPVVNIPPQNNQAVPNNYPAPDNGENREMGLYAEMERRTKELFRGAPNVNPVNYPTPTQGVTPTHQGVLNEGQLQHTVKNVIDQNFQIIVEGAMKNTVVNLFTEERIKGVINESPAIIETLLNENREFIKNMVVDVIREIQDKNKKKKGSK